MVAKGMVIALSGLRNVSCQKTDMLNRLGSVCLTAVKLACVLFFILAPSFSLAVQIKASAGPSFGRIIFAWSQDVSFKTQLQGRTLLIRFSQPVERVPQDIVSRLADYIVATSVSSDGHQISLALRRPFTIRDFKTSDHWVVVDLVETQNISMKSIQEVQENATPRSVLKPQYLPPHLSSPLVPMRAGFYQSHPRIIFDWPSHVGYRIQQDSSRIHVLFDAPARINRPSHRLPEPIMAIRTETGPSDTKIVIANRYAVKAQGFRVDNSIIIDLNPPSPSLASSAHRPDEVKLTQEAVSKEVKLTTADHHESVETQSISQDVSDQKQILSSHKAPLLPPPARPVVNLETHSHDPIHKEDSSKTFLRQDRPDSPVEEESVGFDDQIALDGEAFVLAPPGALQSERFNAPKVSISIGNPVVLAGASGDVLQVAQAHQDAAGETILLQSQGDSSSLEGLDLGTIPPNLRSTRPLPGTPVPVGFYVGKDGATLVFNWPYPAPAAVFVREGYLWFASDEKGVTFDLQAVEARGRGFLGRSESFPEVPGAVLRFQLQRKDLLPTVERQGTAWLIRLAPGKAKPLRRSLTPELKTDKLGNSRYFIPARAPAGTLLVDDPSTATRIYITPTQTTRQGVQSRLENDDAILQATAQGIVVEPKKPAIYARSFEDGVAVTSATGASSSQVEGFAFTDTGADAQEKPLPRLFPLEKWRQGEGESFADNLDILRQKISEVIQRDGKSRHDLSMSTHMRDELNRRRLRLAQFHFAHGFALEARGLIEVILDPRDGDPSLIEDRVFHAMRGVTRYLSDDVVGAERDLALSSLDDEAEAIMWRGMVLAARGRFEEANSAFKDTAPLIDAYPRHIRFKLRIEGMRAAIASRDRDQSETYLDAMLGDNPSDSERSMAIYLQALNSYVFEGRESGIGLLEAAANEVDLLARARASYDLVNAMLERGPVFGQSEQDVIEDAISRLERLRFTWRGDIFERYVLLRLGELHVDNNDYREGLVSLRRVVNYFPGSPQARMASKTMGDIFVDLFLHDKADELSPLESLALFNEFKDLTPVGPKGDAMIRKLADRLVGVDLLEWAARLLEHQVTYRLKKDVERARVAIKLAEIRLADRKPDLAVRALEIGRESVDLPQDLKEYGRLLNAEAFFSLNQNEKALETITYDESDEAERLRGFIHWSMQNWPEAADSFERLTIGRIPPEAALTSDQIRDILNLAASLSLSHDRERLDAIKIRYGPRMKETEFAQAFQVLTSTSAAEGEIRSITQELAEIDTFRDFIASYRPQLGSGRESAIN